MIRLSRVRSESRTRDKKRNRILLSIGSEYRFHITARELASLVKRAMRYKDVRELTTFVRFPRWVHGGK